MSRVIVTGGEGFIGSNFIKLLLNETNYDVVNLDARKYSGQGNNTAHMGLDKHPRYQSVQGDICDCGMLTQLIQKGDFIVNFAAESHVDRSVEEGAALEFLTNNTLGTLLLLEESRRKSVERFVQISTDEVYGSLPDAKKKSVESDGIRSGNPYSASKAAAEQFVLAYANTFKDFDCVITRSSNNYGPYQFPEKFIPVAITELLTGRKIPIYGVGDQKRDWIYVEDNCRGILKVMEEGRRGEVFNIGGGNELSNMDLAVEILRMVGFDPNDCTRRVEFVRDRLGHDFRYSLDCSKIEYDLQWKPRVSFEQGLQETVEWYKKNRAWWEPLKPKPKDVK